MDALRDIFRLVSPDVLLVLLGVCVAVAVAWFVWNRVRALAWLAKCRNLALALLLGAMAATGVYNGFAKIVGEAQFHNASLAQFNNFTISQSDISNGWRVVYTTDGAALTPPFEGVATNGDWRLSGAYDDSMRINPAGWAFPWKNGTMSGITVLSWCEFVPSVMANYFPAPFPDKVSLVPECNWHLIPSNSVPYEGAAALTTNESVFWHGVTTDNSLVLTWQNAAYARDASCPTNFQAELFTNGSFEYRYDDRTVGYSRVHPLDLDFDGLPNAIDPEPETPLATTAWNQSEAWAAVAFPSNAAEIASAGGYAAWVAQRASDPNRRLVGLNIALQGGRWPVCVEVGGVPVMADGNTELLYAIDCGAQVPFVLSDGGLDAVNVTCFVGSPAPQTFTCSGFQSLFFPNEWNASDVTVHFESPFVGWIRRTAEVSVDDQYLTHLYPGNIAQLTAVVTNCHANAYLGCTWSGGNGISFLDPHSLNTIVSYTSTNFVQWATNHVSLVTEYVGGYAITNTTWFTVGQNTEPTPNMTISCQEVFFLNDADFLDGGACPTNRPERIRPVTLNLQAPYGTSGTVTLSAQGTANPVVCYVENDVTNRITGTTRLPLEVTDSFTRMGVYTIYVSCPQTGTGTLTATVSLDGGGTLSDTASFKCIEPLRKLVTTEKDAGRFINPSRLVMGTNAVLQVGVNGDFDATNVHWRVVSGSADISPTNGFTTTVVPTGTNEDVVVEARFNGDEIQPKFVLPVVEPRTIPIKMVIVDPIDNLEVAYCSGEMNASWFRSDIDKMLDEANEVFTQVGITFQLMSVTMLLESRFWRIPYGQQVQDSRGMWTWQCPTQLLDLVINSYTAEDCIRVYFIGEIISDFGAKAMTTPYGIIIGKMATTRTLAHELGHALGLDDCYAFRPLKNQDDIYVPHSDAPVDKMFFNGVEGDWGEESGRGFYDVLDTRKKLMMKMLMHGSASKPDTRSDIPTKYVLSLNRFAKTPSETFTSQVGEKAIKKDNSEVYSK